MSSFWRNFNHWLHWKLSFWQLPVQPVMKISSKWRHFRFSVYRVQRININTNEGWSYRRRHFSYTSMIHFVFVIIIFCDFTSPIWQWKHLDIINFIVGNIHWNKNVVILTKFSSLAALKVVILTTSSAASDEHFIKMKTFPFQCIDGTALSELSMVLFRINDDSIHPRM